MPRKIKERIHREWFKLLSTKTCPCGSNSKRGQPKNPVFAWGEYHAVRWNTIEHFCEKCFSSRVIPKLLSHAQNCGCSFELCSRSGPLPYWIKMPDTNIFVSLG